MSSALDLLIRSILSPNFSWGTTDFSFPSMMKYPPWSLRHSPILKRISRGMPDKIQLSDWTIMGNRPSRILSMVKEVVWTLAPFTDCLILACWLTVMGFIGPLALPLPEPPDNVSPDNTSSASWISPPDFSNACFIISGSVLRFTNRGASIISSAI